MTKVCLFCGSAIITNILRSRPIILRRTLLTTLDDSKVVRSSEVNEHDRPALGQPTKCLERHEDQLTKYP